MTSPLVLAAIEGGVVPEAGEEAGEETGLPVSDEPPALDDRPAVLSAPAESVTAGSGLLHIEAEALSAGGSYFAREAVIALNRREALPYRLRLWRRGARILFPAPEEAR